MLISKNVIFFSITSRRPGSDWCSGIMTNANVSGRSYFSNYFRIRDIKGIRSTSRVINIVMWYNQIRASNSRAGDGLGLTLFFVWSKVTSVLTLLQETSSYCMDEQVHICFTCYCIPVSVYNTPYFRTWPGTRHFYFFIVFKIIHHIFLSSSFWSSVFYYYWQSFPIYYSLSAGDPLLRNILRILPALMAH